MNINKKPTSSHILPNGIMGGGEEPKSLQWNGTPSNGMGPNLGLMRLVFRSVLRAAAAGGPGLAPGAGRGGRAAAPAAAAAGGAAAAAGRRVGWGWGGVGVGVGGWVVGVAQRVWGVGG